MWINIEKLQGFILKDKEILQAWHLLGEIQIARHSLVYWKNILNKGHLRF